MGLPFAPGISTPSDIEIAVEHGCRLLKYFPAESSGGLAHLTGMAAPYAHLKLRYIPLGGLTQANMADYLKSPLVAALGGSWIAKPEVIKARDWAAITAAAAAATKVVQAVRG
jgi:2-dehydro-3-deoxyphosphogluconate aldolase/(4S)-4-hydroxy-2-oxoglutarate aldolase